MIFFFNLRFLPIKIDISIRASIIFNSFRLQLPEFRRVEVKMYWFLSPKKLSL